MNPLPHMRLTAELLAFAQTQAQAMTITRTKASPADALIGAIGEVCFSKAYFGEVRSSAPGTVDFDGIEVKCSAFPISPFLHLLVREDYAAKRAARAYVHIVIDKPRGDTHFVPGDVVYFCGWATHDEVCAAPLRDMGSKFGGAAGYRSHALPFCKLRDMHALRAHMAVAA